MKKKGIPTNINEMSDTEVLRKILVNYKNVRLRVDYMNDRITEIDKLYVIADEKAKDDTKDALILLKAKCQLGIETCVYWLELISKICDFIPFDNKEKTCLELYYINNLTEEQILSKIGISKATLYRSIDKALVMLCNIPEVLEVVDEYRNYYKDIKEV